MKKRIDLKQYVKRLVLPKRDQPFSSKFFIGLHMAVKNDCNNVVANMKEERKLIDSEFIEPIP